MSARALSSRRSAETAAILRLKKRLQALGFFVTAVGPEGVTVSLPPMGTILTKPAE